MPAPWIRIQNSLAKTWGMPPWEIDLDDPVIEDHVRRTLAMWEIEAAQKKPKHMR